MVMVLPSTPPSPISHGSSTAGPSPPEVLIGPAHDSGRLLPRIELITSGSMVEELVSLFKLGSILVIASLLSAFLFEDETSSVCCGVVEG